MHVYVHVHVYIILPDIQCMHIIANIKLTQKKRQKSKEKKKRHV